MRVGANTPERENAIAGGHPTVRHAVESILLEERTRWAMQIHDGLTQSVTSAILELQTLRHRIATDAVHAVGSQSTLEPNGRLSYSRPDATSPAWCLTGAPLPTAAVSSPIALAGTI